MSQTTTPSGADVNPMSPPGVLTVLVATEFAATNGKLSPIQIELLSRAQDAVAAILARNAELEAANVELERLCDATYVAQGADAYNHACETMEVWQEARFLAGKDRGCEGSLCDGLSWLQSQVTKLEDDRDALAAENKALRVDAERYQWLRNEAIDYPYAETIASPWCVYGPDSDAYPSRPIDREELDAAVDAARTPANGDNA